MNTVSVIVFKHLLILDFTVAYKIQNQKAVGRLSNHRYEAYFARNSDFYIILTFILSI